MRRRVGLADLAQAQHDLVPFPVQPDDLDRHLLPELDDVHDLPDRGPGELRDMDQAIGPQVRAWSVTDLHGRSVAGQT